MKKLMIAAAVAAMTAGAFAVSCEEEEAESQDCIAYDFTMKVTTLKTKTKGQTGCNGDTEAVAYYVKGTRSFTGFLWDCEWACEDAYTATPANFSAWEKSTKKTLTPLYDSESVTAGEFPIEIWRFGKKAEYVQGYLDTVFEGEIKDEDSIETPIVFQAHLAGIGSYDSKNELVKNVKGYVVGVFTPEAYVDCEETYAPQVYDPCAGDFENWIDSATDDAPYAVGYGSWNIKYSKSKTNSTKAPSSYIPSYARQ